MWGWTYFQGGLHVGNSTEYCLLQEAVRHFQTVKLGGHIVGDRMIFTPPPYLDPKDSLCLVED